MDKILAIITAHIDFVALSLVILGGLFAKNYTNEKVLPAWWLALPTTWRTLVVGTVFMSIWCVIQYYSGILHKGDLGKLFYTYCVATSLYELILRYLFDFISKKFGVSIPDNEK